MDVASDDSIHCAALWFRSLPRPTAFVPRAVSDRGMGGYLLKHECRHALTPAVVRGGPRHKVHAHTISSAAATAVTAIKMAVNASLIMPNTVAGPIGRLGTITAVLRGVG